MRRKSIVLVLAMAAATAACGGDSGGGGAAQKAPADSAAGGGASGGKEVTIETFQFQPATLEVSVGDTVTWKNGDSILHTATSGTRTYDPGDSGRVTKTNKDGQFDLQLEGKGSSASHRFTKAGKFHYFCDRHPGMEADITVTG